MEVFRRSILGCKIVLTNSIPKEEEDKEEEVVENETERAYKNCN